MSVSCGHCGRACTGVRGRLYFVVAIWFPVEADFREKEGDIHLFGVNRQRRVVGAIFCCAMDKTPVCSQTGKMVGQRGGEDRWTAPSFK